MFANLSNNFDLIKGKTDQLRVSAIPRSRLVLGWRGDAGSWKRKNAERDARRGGYCLVVG
jgi:hypothetical protein